MPRLLPTIRSNGGSDRAGAGCGETPITDGAAEWGRFLARRDDLTARMEMATCDGCDGCGLRCMDGFTVTRAEYEAVQVYLATLPPEETARVAAQEKTVPWPGAEESGATVTYCRYRDTERENCSVYPARPTICRLFGQTEWLPCPIGAVERFPADAASLWNKYRTFERRTWAEWDKATG
jgi:ferredoxin